MSGGNGNGGALVQDPMAVERKRKTALVGAIGNRIREVLPKHMDAARFIRVVAGFVANLEDKHLEKMDDTSFLSSVLLSAQIGLEPNNGLGHAWLLPYWDSKSGRYEVQLQIGYKGWVELVRRSNQVARFYAFPVYENDEFSYEYGLELKLVHKPARRNRGEVVAAYAVAIMKDGEPQIEVLDGDALEKLRAAGARTRGGKDSPAIKEWFEEWSRAKAAKRLAKWLPLSSEVHRAGVIDDAYDAGLRPTIEGDIVRTEEPKALAEPARTVDAIFAVPREREPVSAHAREDKPLEPAAV